MVATGQEHVDLHVQFNCQGDVVVVQGSPDCFYKSILHNLFKFVTLGSTPDKNILRNWNKRKKTFGSQNLGKGHIGTATVLLIHNLVRHQGLD